MEIIKMTCDNSLCLMSPTQMASIQSLHIFKILILRSAKSLLVVYANCNQTKLN